MKPRRTVSQKRKLVPAPTDAVSKNALLALSRKATYGGNPEHKRNPGDFGLSPPALPRQGKSLPALRLAAYSEHAIGLKSHLVPLVGSQMQRRDAVTVGVRVCIRGHSL